MVGAAQFRTGAVLGLSLVGACSSHSSSSTPAGEIAGCPTPAGTLTLYAIPATERLDWTSPNTLFNTVVASDVAGTALVHSGKAALGHELGHVNLEMTCGSLSIPLTGQTSDSSDSQILTDGFGVVFLNTPGVLTEMPGADHDSMVKDIALRKASGLVTEISFTINETMCTRLKAFHDAYIAANAYKNYSGIFRARRFEGAGCAIFGAAFVDVGGLLRRSLITPAWSQTVFVGSARFSNYGGSTPYFAFGSNTVAPDDAGVDWLWPEGVNIPASTTLQVTPNSTAGDSWTGPEDAPFGIASLPDELQTKVPFSIYDPQKMVDWAESVWQEAAKSGSASSLGATWTASTVGASHQITYDATCVMPQTLAFTADNDDLFKDSDAP